MLFAQQYDMEKLTEEFHKIGAHLSKLPGRVDSGEHLPFFIKF